MLAFAATAQETTTKNFILGGTIGVNTSSEAYSFDGTKWAANNSATPTDVTIAIMPTFGYQFNQNILAGITLGYVSSTSTIKTANPVKPEELATTNKTTTSAFVIGAWGRYNLFNISKFTVFAELEADFGFGTIENINTIENPKTENTLADNSLFAFNASIVPGLNYAFSDSFSMDLYLNLLGLSYDMRQNTNHMGGATNDKDAITTTREFGLNCDLMNNSIDDFTAAVTVGFNFHF